MIFFKSIFSLLFICIFFVVNNQAVAEGCFHDRIDIVNKAGIVTKGANIRNVACMDGSNVIATLSQGTKVRIIGQTAWTKIVLPDGRIGRIGNSFIQETNDRSDVPGHPENHKVDSYCDTTQVTRCPNPVPPGVQPTWYYIDQPSPSPITQPAPHHSFEQEYTPIQIQLTEINKSMLDHMAQEFVKKVENEFSRSINNQIDKIQKVVLGLEMFEKKSYKLALIISYLRGKIEEELAIKQLQEILNI